jgi:hypothetical protein
MICPAGKAENLLRETGHEFCKTARRANQRRNTIGLACGIAAPRPQAWIVDLAVPSNENNYEILTLYTQKLAATLIHT